MRNETYFSQNWNNKLSCDYFTTIRLKDENKYVIGEIHAIYLNRKLIAHAEIIEIRHFLIKDINEYVAGLDSGYCADEFRIIIRKMYQKYNIDWNHRQLSFILFHKQKNTAGTYKSQQQATKQSA